jgi:hypothetical protein
MVWRDLSAHVEAKILPRRYELLFPDPEVQTLQDVPDRHLGLAR